MKNKRYPTVNILSVNKKTLGPCQYYFNFVGEGVPNQCRAMQSSKAKYDLSDLDLNAYGSFGTNYL